MARPGIGEVRRALEIGLRGLVFHATLRGLWPRFARLRQHLLKALGDRAGAGLAARDDRRTLQSDAPSAASRKRSRISSSSLGHPVFTEEQRAQCVSAVQSNGNLNLDLAYQADPATTEFFVREVGAARMLFGSDAPYFEPSQVIASIEAARITDAEKEQIFSGNAERLIKSVR